MVAVAADEQGMSGAGQGEEEHFHSPLPVRLMSRRALCSVGHNMTGPASSVRRARRSRGGEVSGCIVTWDVDSGDAGQCARVRRFVFGYSTASRGRTYRHPGFVEREGVRYLGQSVLFVTAEHLSTLHGFLDRHAVGHVVTRATLGRRISA